MQSIPEHIKLIVDKIFDGTASEAEVQQANDWYHSFGEEEVELDTDETEQSLSTKLKKKLLSHINKGGSQHTPKLYFWRAAVVVLVVSATLVYFILSGSWYNQKQETRVQPVASVQEEIKPGTNKAVLILHDGTEIELDSSENGALGQQGNTKIIKLADGRVKYNDNKLQKSSVVLYNTIATPRGGQYQVQLPDGTNVWLNASSSIRFPAEFAGGDRKVEITGEVYFEVAHKAGSPFWVRTNQTEIKVLGTRFNVMAYENEYTLNTTLLEGSLIIQQDKYSQLMKPGNQVKLKKSGEAELVKEADVEEAVAWKNGKFLFASASMESIMRQVERWYDVEVQFDSAPDVHLSGQLTRYASVKELLRKLELTNEVHFKIEKRKIIVVPGKRP